MVRGRESAYDASMTSIFLRTVLTATLLMAPPALSLADGRADWPLYAWQQIRTDTCVPVGTALQCPPYHQKWDWKRNQWVDIVIEIDRRSNTLTLVQRLTDNNSGDDDYVCVTAIAVDAAGNNILAHHQNWQMTSGAVRENTFTYRSTRLADIATIHVGSRQCRGGAGQDDAIYARVLAGIRP